MLRAFCLLRRLTIVLLIVVVVDGGDRGLLARISTALGAIMV